MLKFKMLTLFSFQVKPLPPQKVLNRPVLIKQNNQTIISFLCSIFQKKIEHIALAVFSS